MDLIYKYALKMYLTSAMYTLNSMGMLYCNMELPF